MKVTSSEDDWNYRIGVGGTKGHHRTRPPVQGGELRGCWEFNMNISRQKVLEAKGMGY